MYKIKKDDSGVFSNFLRAIDWFWYSCYTGEKICVDWTLNGKDLLEPIFHHKGGCETLLYETDKFVEKSNLSLNEKIANRRNSISFYEKYRGYFYTTPEVYFESDFQVLREEMFKGFQTGFEYKDEFKSLPQTNLIGVDERVLGIHVRNPLHYRHNDSNPYPIQTDKDVFFSETAEFTYKEMEKGRYEKVYVACENSQMFNHMVQLVGENSVIQIDCQRIKENIDWFDKPNLNMEAEVLNCFIDVYNLTKCKKIMGTTSNMFFGTLVMNPKTEFGMLPISNHLHGF